MIIATPAHAVVMAAIHGAAFPAAPWDASSFVALLEHPTTFGWIDARGGLILLRTAADEAEILTIAAHPPRRGVGRALLDHAIAASGATRIFLEVGAGNVAAQALYAAVGFIQVGRRAAYYADKTDALVLSLSL